MTLSLFCPHGHPLSAMTGLQNAETLHACPVCGATLVPLHRAPAQPSPDPDLLRTEGNATPQPTPNDPWLTRHGESVPEVQTGTSETRRAPLANPPSPDGYEILDLIGRGGMGVVYKARQTKLNRLVALKMVLAGGHVGAEMLNRFRFEAEAIGRIRHPNIVQVYDFGWHQGQPYFSLEYADNGSLAQRLTGLPQPVRLAAEMTETLARAAHAAHQQGIIHRDLKPANVLIVADGTLKLTDFGLARNMDDTVQTATGAVLGTPSYMAPEQAQGNTREISLAADVYSLGALLYTFLTGRPPFTAATSLDTLRQVVYDEPVPPSRLNSHIPRDLDTICLKCLQKAPERRYASAEALANDLRAYLDDRPIQARPVSALERTTKWVRRRPAATALLGVSVFASLVLLIGGLIFTVQLANKRDLLEQQQVQLIQQRNAVETQRDEARKANRERLDAMIDQLRTAAPEAVPSTLKNLEPVRADVKPRLRELWDAETSPAQRQQRMRVALALLPVEPDLVKGSLFDWMLDAEDPREFEVTRDVLAVFGPELKEQLWDKVRQPRTPPSVRFRALVALALFDPKSAAWQDAGKGVLEPWLSSNPLYLDVWTRALRPAQAHLLAPLRDVFEGRIRQLADRREQAGYILAMYSADQPEVLVGLLAEADERQFHLFYPKLAAHRDKVAKLLEQELDRQPASRWPEEPLDPTWKTPLPAVEREVEQASGFVAERFALCQTLPLERFLPLTQELERSGYRPARLRPFRAAGKMSVAAVWMRDGRKWRLTLNAAPNEIRDRDASVRREGFRPVDVAGYLGGKDGQSELYCAVWLQSAGDKEVSQLSLGLPLAEHETASKAFMPGYRPQAYQVFLDRQGQRRYSAIWTKADLLLSWRLRFLSEAANYDSQALTNGLLVDVTVLPTHAQTTRRELALAERLAKATADLKNKPNSLDALFQRGRTWYDLGNYDRALADLDDVIRQNKSTTFAGAHQYRALTHARLGNEREAGRDLEEFLRRSQEPGSRAAVEALVAIYLGREETALKQLETALAGQEGNARFLCDAAAVYAQTYEVNNTRIAETVASLAAALGGTMSIAIPIVGQGANQRRRAQAQADRVIVLLEKAFAAQPEEAARRMRTDLDLDPLRTLPKFLSLSRKLDLDRQYSAAWQDNSAFTSAESHGLDAAAHREHARRLATEGFRPGALSVTEVDDGRLATASAWQRPVPTEAECRLLARRQANLACALLLLNRPDRVWPLYQQKEDPTLSSYLIHRAPHLGVAAHLLATRLLAETNVTARRSLILSLGEFTSAQLDQLHAELRAQLTDRLLDWYRRDPDPGIHGAVDWLLRNANEGPEPREANWMQQPALARIDADLRGQQPPPGRRWFVNGQGQSFALLVGPTSFYMGSPVTEPDRIDNEELLHRRRVERSFALATRPVTVAQFQQFLKETGIRHSYPRRHNPDANCPILYVSWYEAAQYCNWLSEKEGIPKDEWVYPSLDEIEKSKDGKTPLKLAANHLMRKGYRLPTEVEWEYACRAGTTSSRYYGRPDDLLGYYGWYQHNSQERTWPVGQKKPNGFGLFDMHGTAWTWCQESARPYQLGPGGKLPGDEEDPQAISDLNGRVLRGGSFSSPTSHLRAAFRNNNRPSDNAYTTGFRVARTIP